MRTVILKEDSRIVAFKVKTINRTNIHDHNAFAIVDFNHLRFVDRIRIFVCHTKVTCFDSIAAFVLSCGKLAISPKNHPKSSCSY